MLKQICHICKRTIKKLYALGEKMIKKLHTICALIFLSSTMYPTHHFNVMTPENSGINSVVFDVGDVLVETSSKAKAWVLTPTLCLSPKALWAAIAYQFKIKQELYNALHEVPADTHPDMAIYNQNQRMPQVMVDWMLARESKPIGQRAIAHMQESDRSNGMKAILERTMNFIFDPEELVSSQVKVEPMHKLVHALKEKGYKLYVLSNFSADAFELLEQKYPETFQAFDGAVVSGREGQVKPDPSIYNTLIERHGLTVDKSIFIDDEPHNIDAAQKLGFHAVLKDSNESVCKRLQELGVLQEKANS